MALLSEFGPVESLFTKSMKHTQKRYGFAVFKTEESSKKALEKGKIYICTSKMFIKPYILRTNWKQSKTKNGKQPITSKNQNTFQSFNKKTSLQLQQNYNFKNRTFSEERQQYLTQKTQNPHKFQLKHLNSQNSQKNYLKQQKAVKQNTLSQIITIAKFRETMAIDPQTSLDDRKNLVFRSRGFFKDWTSLFGKMNSSVYKSREPFFEE